MIKKPTKKQTKHIYHNNTEKKNSGLFTQRIMGGAFENNAVCGEEEGSLCWQDVWAPQEAPCGLLPTVGVQKHPQPL